MRGDGMTLPADPRPRSRGHLGLTEIAISARRVTTRPTDSGPALRDISLDVLRGQITVVCGAPGSGKTALLRLLAGLDRPDAGAVWIGDRYVGAAAGSPPWRFRRDERAFIGQTPTGVPGERAASIMRAIAPKPDLVFVDEPATGLGPGELDRLHAALYALTAVGGQSAVVATGHPQIATWADRLTALDNGALILDLDGPTPAEARATALSLAGPSALL